MNFAYLKRYIFRILKKNKTIFNIVEWIKWHKEIDYHNQTNSSVDLKNKNTIESELKIIRKYWRCGTFHYFRYGLQYKELTTEQLLDYVPTFYFHKNIEKKHRYIDTIKYGDKLHQARLFDERNIQSPNTLCIYRKGSFYDYKTNQSINIETIINNSLIFSDNKLFFKPTGNCGGKGILILKKINDNYFINNIKIDSLNQISNFINKNNTYIIQEKVEQNKLLNLINASSLNTIRVVTQKENNKMIIKSCILRMGRKGKEVDNSAQGGISIKIDTTTGQFADYATAEHGSGKFVQHPDSGFIFKDQHIKNWPTIKDKITAIANKLIDFNDIALDIALTKDDVMLIEFNFRYGVEHQQCVLGGVRQLFNISNK